MFSLCYYQVVLVLTNPTLLSFYGSAPRAATSMVTALYGLLLWSLKIQGPDAKQFPLAGASWRTVF